MHVNLRNTLLTLALVAAATPFASWQICLAQPPHELDVLPRAQIDPKQGKQQLQTYLLGLAEAAFARRRQEYEAIKRPEQLTWYQQRRREFFLKQLGEFPERTPLHARTVGTIKHDACRIEKVIFESRPRHYVTALLYLPLTAGPYPGVIVPCGHSPNGKAADAYQRVCMLLAHGGIAALCYDPIGQGERYQILDDTGLHPFNCTTEHTLVGVGSILIGRNTAHFRIWDGIRALDYLAARDDIDPQRLGCTGNSGGGTLTEYLMALDDRIACAAPSCCVTSFERRLATIGPGDAEQNIFGQIAFGLDHADYTLMRAPRPTLLLTATHDFVDIDGAWDIFREAKRVYTRLGFAERVDLVEADTKHGFSQLKREAAVRWMRRWLLKIDEPLTEPKFKILTDREAQCTPQGQVQLLPDALSVFDMNLAARFIERRGSPPKEIREVTGIHTLGELPAATAVSLGKIEREGYTITRQLISTEPGITLPALWFVPQQVSGRRYLYIHGGGKRLAAGVKGPIETLVLAGSPVLAVDLRGMGELGSDGTGLWGGNWDDIFLSYLLGRSMLALRTEDILTVSQLLRERTIDGTPEGMVVVATGVAGPPALHAVGLEPELFARLELIDTEWSWNAALGEVDCPGQLVNAVHGALRHYNFGDLKGMAQAGKVEVKHGRSPPRIPPGLLKD